MVLKRCSGRNDRGAAAQGESCLVQLHDGAVYAVAVVEIVFAELEFALEVGGLEMRRPVDEESVEDEGLVLQVVARVVGAMRHRVLISHEELALLVVRPSVGVSAPAGGCFLVWARVARLRHMYLDTIRRPSGNVRHVRHSQRPQPALGMAIRELREKRGVSQVAVAKDAGVTGETLSLIERGHANPTWATARDLAAALDVSITELAKLSEKHH